MGFISLQV